MHRIAALLFAILFTLPAAAQEAYPSKPITVVVPYAPGGGSDFLGRVLAEGPPDSLGASRYRVAWRDASGTTVERFTDDPTALLAGLTADALARGERLEELSVTRPSLEDVYLQLTAEVPEEVRHG